MTSDEATGEFLAQTTLDALAILNERHTQNAQLLAAQITLIVKDKGKIRIVNVIKERK